MVLHFKVFQVGGYVCAHDSTSEQTVKRLLLLRWSHLQP